MSAVPTRRSAMRDKKLPRPVMKIPFVMAGFLFAPCECSSATGEFLSATGECPSATGELSFPEKT